MGIDIPERGHRFSRLSQEARQCSASREDLQTQGPNCSTDYERSLSNAQNVTV